MNGYEIVGYEPGVLGWCVALHGRYYAEHAGFGAFFEAKVAAEMAEFAERLNLTGVSLFQARCGTGPLGTVAIDMGDAEDGRAHLRWFIVDPAAQGRGIGSALIDRAKDAARQADARGIFLWTFDGLQAARAVYLKAGFRLVREHPGDTWGSKVIEQRYEFDF